MQLIHTFEPCEIAAFAGLAGTVMVSGARLAGLAQTCRDLGLKVECSDERYAALGAIADDPAGYSVLLQDCNDSEDAALGHRSALWLRSIAPRVAVILVMQGSARVVQADIGRYGVRLVVADPATPQDLRQALGQAFGMRPAHSQG